MNSRITLPLLWLFTSTVSVAQTPAPLTIEARIPLGAVKGRIDHLAIDIARQRLFVAELGNDTVGVVDLATRSILRRLSGLDEPQGIAYMPSTDTLYVANGGDGSLRIFRGAELTSVQTVSLGDDADNVRIDHERRQIYVGYGSGALALIDPTTHQRTANIALKGHPESFQLDASGSRIYVNVPDAHEIAVIDRKTNKQVASWPTGELRANYPMAVDESGQRLLTVFRQPATVAAFGMPEGQKLTELRICGDADDIFRDAKRDRVYVSCGEGYVDILRPAGEKYVRIAQVKTVTGARTALFVPAADRLYLAVRANGSEPAAIWILKPAD